MDNQYTNTLQKRNSCNLSLKIPKLRIFRFLMIVIIGFGVLNLAAAFARFLPDFPLRDFFVVRFNVDNEKSFPTLFSVFILQACSVLLALISCLVKVQKDNFLRHWQGLSLIFLCLSIDESLSFHERSIIPIRNLIDSSGFLYFAWVIPAAILLMIFLMTYLKFIRSLPRRIRNLFILSGSIFVAGAVGIEMISGKILDIALQTSIIYSLSVAFEEFFEMLGIAIFIYSLLSYLKLKSPNISFSIY